MANDPVEVLNEVFPWVLESCAFMFADPIALSEVDEQASFLAATVQFDGAAVGALTVAVPRPHGPELAANMLGLDVEDLKAYGLAPDALGEVTNVCCAHVLTAIAGTTATCNMRAPRAYPASLAELLDGGPATAIAAFLIAEKPAIVILRKEQERS